MPSPAHALFLEAMREKRPVACTYQGHIREICPIMLGRTALEEKALVFQFGGTTSAGRLTKPDWKCFFLDEVRDAVLLEGRWHAGTPAFGRPALHENGRIRRQSEQPLQPGVQAVGAALPAGLPSESWDPNIRAHRPHSRHPRA